MAFFRKKPVVIEAIRWTGDNLAALVSWGAPVTILPATNATSLIIGTLEDGPNCEAMHVATFGDWIIRGVAGEFYPCKPAIFAETYDSVTNPKNLVRAYDKTKKRRQDWLVDNGPCKQCGSTDQLQVDHIDPRSKITHNVWSWSKNRREEELAKCQVLCIACHKTKTHEQNYARFPAHGRGAYRRGCRCDVCRRAIADRAIQWRLKKKTHQ